MNEIEKMKRYIARTKISNDSSYQMSLREAMDLAHASTGIPASIVCLAFNYGKAKGYRAAKAEARKA